MLLQLKLRHVEVGTHVLGIGRARERQHANVECEVEDDLRYGATVACSDADQLGMGPKLARCRWSPDSWR